MPPTWTDLGSEHYGSGQRIADGGIFTKLEDNDEVAVEHVWQLLFHEQSTTTVSPSFATLWSITTIVPASAKTLRITLEAKATAGGHLKGTLANPSMDSDTQNVSSSSYGEITLTWSDVTTARGNRVTIEIKGNVNSSGTLYARSTDRITCRWGFE